MNAFNQQQLNEDFTGLLESCDRCNILIRNWYWMGWAFFTFDNRIICNNCRSIELKEKIEKELTEKQKTLLIHLW